MKILLWLGPADPILDGKLRNYCILRFEYCKSLVQLVKLVDEIIEGTAKTAKNNQGQNPYMGWESYYPITNADVSSLKHSYWLYRSKHWPLERRFWLTLLASALNSCKDWLMKFLKFLVWFVCSNLSSSIWLRSVKTLLRNAAAELAIPILLSIWNSFGWGSTLVKALHDICCCSLVGLIVALMFCAAIRLDWFRFGVGGGDFSWESTNNINSFKSSFKIEPGIWFLHNSSLKTERLSSHILSVVKPWWELSCTVMLNTIFSTE